MFWIPDVIPFANLAEIIPALVFVMVLRLYHAVRGTEPRERGAPAEYWTLRRERMEER